MSKKSARAAEPIRSASTLVALLRGINVGGKNQLSMSDLVSVFTEAGCSNVKTYIQSGNVVLAAAPKIAARLPTVIAASIERRLGLRIPLILRTAQELERVALGNPFLKSGAETNALHVMFLAELPQASAVAGLDPGRSPPDEFAVVGGEIYLRCPNGVAKTKLTNAYFDARLATTSTARNWRTVLKLIELARG